jgi:hypothetical protein
MYPAEKWRTKTGLRRGTAYRNKRSAGTAGGQAGQRSNPTQTRVGNGNGDSDWPRQANQDTVIITESRVQTRLVKIDACSISPVWVSPEKNLVQLSRQENDLAMDRRYMDCNGFGNVVTAFDTGLSLGSCSVSSTGPLRRGEGRPG